MSVKDTKETKKTTDEVVDMVEAERKAATPNMTTTDVSKTDLEIARLVRTQDESFPDGSSIELVEGWRNPYEFPKWCDHEKYEYGWAPVHDKVALDVAINFLHWRIVNRSNHYSAPYQDFHHNHGAIERRSELLVYRPWAIARKMRDIPVQTHRERTEAIEGGKQLPGAELTAGRFDGETGVHKSFSGQVTGKDLRPGSDPKPGEIFAAESPGEEGLRLNDNLQL